METDRATTAGEPIPEDRYRQSIIALGRESFREELLRAKELTGGQRMSASLRLFDESSRRVLAGIRAQFPELNEEEVREVRRQRYDRIRRLEERKREL